MLAGWLVAFIAMQMASTLRAGRNERKRGSWMREREETSDPGANERERSSADAAAAVAVAAAVAAVAACACTRFFLRPSLCFWPLHNYPPSLPAPLPSCGARTRGYGRPIAVLPLSPHEECEYTCIHFCMCVCVYICASACTSVGEIASSVRNGACAPHVVFIFLRKE